MTTAFQIRKPLCVSIRRASDFAVAFVRAAAILRFRFCSDCEWT